MENLTLEPYWRPSRLGLCQQPNSQDVAETGCAERAAFALPSRKEMKVVASELRRAARRGVADSRHTLCAIAVYAHARESCLEGTVSTAVISNRLIGREKGRKVRYAKTRFSRVQKYRHWRIFFSFLPLPSLLVFAPWARIVLNAL